MLLDIEAWLCWFISGFDRLLHIFDRFNPVSVLDKFTPISIAYNMTVQESLSITSFTLVRGI